VQNNTAHHDGLSFMIMNIQWLTNGSQSSGQVRGKARRDRINKGLREIEGIWNSTANGKTANNASAAVMKAGLGSVGGAILSTNGWFKAAVRPGNEGDKENQPAAPEPDEVAAEPAPTAASEEGKESEAPPDQEGKHPEPTAPETSQQASAAPQGASAAAPADGAEEGAAAPVAGTSERATEEAAAPIPTPDS